MCHYWSSVKIISFCFEIFFAKNQNTLAFHPGPVQPPGGEGSSLLGLDSKLPFFQPPRTAFVQGWRSFAPACLVGSQPTRKWEEVW